MHILICAVSSAQRPTGICRHAANLAGALSARKEVRQVTLLVGRWQAGYFDLAFRISKSGPKIIPVDVANNAYARNRWYWKGLPRLYHKYRPDIIQLSFPVPFLRRRFLCPVVVSLHDCYPYDIPGNFGRLRVGFNRLFLEQCLRESDLVVCSSDFTREQLAAHSAGLPREKVTRIYQSVALDPSSFQTPGALQLGGRPFLLAVAQHRRNKNIALLIAAFAELRRRRQWDPAMCLVIVGSSGPETGRLRKLVRHLSLEESVLFTTALPDPELCWLYRDCKLLVAPSIVEGFGLPVAEALACGSQVLCSDIPVFREVGGARCHYFRLHEPNAVAALADAIDTALRESKATPRALGAFSPSEIAAQHLKVYDGLIRGNRESAEAGRLTPASIPVGDHRVAS